MQVNDAFGFGREVRRFRPSDYSARGQRCEVRVGGEQFVIEQGRERDTARAHATLAEK
jgi:hypothetical protein